MTRPLPRIFADGRDELDVIMAFWSQGLNTCEIGRLLNLDEDAVYRVVVSQREAEYEARQTHRQVA